MIVSPDGQTLITNDGATIVDKMEVAHPISRLMVELSMSQDNQIGDGTTGVVILAGMLVEQALLLLEKGIHPLKIASGFDKASVFVTQHLHTLTEPNQDLDTKELEKSAMIALSSKVVAKYKEKLAALTVQAVLKVADKETKEVNLELIKIVSKVGGSLEETELIEGVLIDKDFSHPQMEKRITDAKVAVLTCPFEPPKPKTKYNLNITNAKDFKELA